MKTAVFEFYCSACGAKFRATAVSDFAYGRLLCRAASGEVRYVDCFDDLVFSEIAGIVDTLLVAPLDDARAAGVQREAFSLACDSSSNGERFEVGVAPRCPHCGASRGERGQVPVDFVVLDAVTHNTWEATSPAQRRELVREVLLRFDS